MSQNKRKKPLEAPPSERELISEAELRVLRGFSATTCWRYRKSGRLVPEIIINGRPYYSRDALPLSDAELAARQQGDAA